MDRGSFIKELVRTEFEVRNENPQQVYIFLFV
jgi:hypothetical protein